MKKTLLAAFPYWNRIASATSAQDKENKVKIKKTSTLPQKVHNTFSKHKKYSGVKMKAKVDKASTTTKKD